MLGVGYWVLAVGYWLISSNFLSGWVFDVGSWVLVDIVQLLQWLRVWCWALGVCWVVCCLVIGVVFWVLGVGCLALGVGGWVLRVEYVVMGVGCWVLGVG